VLVTILAFVVVIGVLIFVHELGHYLAAKAVGIGVPRFSIGFGPATPLAFRWGETEYVVSWFPVGGYVKMASREEQEAMGAVEGGGTPADYPPEKLFENKPLAARVLVLSAGVAMNALFAWVVYFVLALTVGRAESPVTTIAFVDSTVLPAQARELGRIPEGTRVVAVSGDSVDTWNDITSAVLDPTSEALRFDFAGHDPVVVPIPGTNMSSRAAIAEALKPAWAPVISALQAGSPADRAGLRPGDRIVRLGGDTVRYWDDLRRVLERRAGDSLAITLLRGDSLVESVIVPELQSEQDLLTGDAVQVAKIGVYPRLETVQVDFGLLEAIAEGTRRTGDNFNQVLFTLKGMVVGQISVRELGGPIFIGQISGQFAQAGVIPLLVFMAFLSVNLAVLNLLPIPVLDGGHLVFLALEGVRGKPLSLEWRIRLTQIGVMVILGLTVLVFANDILRIFGG
jgi:regulator of sigma E protease